MNCNKYDVTLMSQLEGRVVLIDRNADTTAVCCIVRCPQLEYEDGLWSVNLCSRRLSYSSARTVSAYTPLEALERAMRVTRPDGPDHAKIIEELTAAVEEDTPYE